ncbi:MAG: hypothetical protein LBQ35_04975 [Spirochaetaceae bacterium]|jgi:hypothetical protein|nr:hypothetical protein [Spirochaetaceae bacterium]
MLSREEFVFTIGYDGPLAVVDGQALKRYGRLSTQELAERGLFRAAYSSALYSKDAGELRLVAEVYNRTASEAAADPASLDRLFGVLPTAAKRAITL